jgi:L-amino acid N-acyltransferase YncA
MVTSTDVEARVARLSDGALVNIRPMVAGDARAMLHFAQSLPEEDLLFLRTDITTKAGVDEWVANLRTGRTTTVVADAGGVIAGYASIHHNNVSWQRHLGEVRANVGQRFRGKGLGRALADAIFELGKNMGLIKIVALMTPQESAAIRTFEELGFVPEAVLRHYVVDREGRPHDMVVMGHDVSGLTDRA